MATGKALVCHPKGDQNSLVLEDVPIPKPEAKQVLVKVQAVAQNPTDAQSFDNNAFGKCILGCDFVGIVEELGPGVTRLQKGDQIGCLIWGGNGNGLGAFATYCIADEAICYKVPSILSPAEASTIPLALNTSWLAFFAKTTLAIDRSKGAKNEVLVWGGSSSVGLFALQLAKMYDFNVATVCSPRNFDLVKEAGAKHVFDYHSPTVVEDIKKALPNLEYVWDTIGNSSSSVIASQAVRPEGGVLCTVRPGKTFTENVDSRVRVTDVVVYTAFNRPWTYLAFKFPASEADYQLSSEMYHNLPSWIESGKIKPNKAKVLGGLDKVPEGFQLYRDNKISGEKVVYVL